MAQQIINLGTVDNDGTGDPLKAALDKSNDNFTELYASGALKAPLASPAFTGTPTAPTAAPGTNTTQLATTAFVTAIVTGLLKLKGDTDASANPNYPAAIKGDAYVVTVAGKVGGASGVAVDIGDVYAAKADNAGGTQASVGASWFVLEHNLAGALLAANNLSDLANAATARTNLGLGSMATQAASAVAITGGSVTGITDITVADGGTGASTASAARTNLGLAIGGDVQAWDADLDAVAALSPSNDDIMQRKSGAWVNRTLTQLRADLGTSWIVGKSAVAVPLTGSTSATTLATITIPAGAIGPNGQVEVIALFSATNSANNKTMTVRFGGSILASTTQTAIAALQVYVRSANRNATNSQISNQHLTGFGTSTLAPVATSTDTTAPVDVTITAQLGNSGETITLESYLVRITYGA